MRKNKLKLVFGLMLLAGIFCNTKTMNSQKGVNKKSVVIPSKLLFDLKLLDKQVNSAKTSSEAQKILNQINSEEKEATSIKNLLLPNLLAIGGFTTFYFGSRLLDNYCKYEDQHKSTEEDSKFSYKKHSLTLVSAIGCGAMFSGGALALNNIRKEITLWKTKDQRQTLKNQLIEKIKKE